jgi:hypothetical protein
LVSEQLTFNAEAMAFPPSSPIELPLRLREGERREGRKGRTPTLLGIDWFEGLERVSLLPSGR